MAVAITESTDSTDSGDARGGLAVLAAQFLFFRIFA
jgi:hypothetical protein